MDTVARVQTVDEAVCISLSRKCLMVMHWLIVAQIGLFNLGAATDLGEGKLWFQTAKKTWLFCCILPVVEGLGKLLILFFYKIQNLSYIHEFMAFNKSEYQLG